MSHYVAAACYTIEIENLMEKVLRIEHFFFKFNYSSEMSSLNVKKKNYKQIENEYIL